MSITFNTPPLKSVIAPSRRLVLSLLAAGVLTCTVAQAAAADAPAAPADPAAAASAANPASPQALIRTIAEDVLNSIKKDPGMQSGDPARVMTLVDQKIAPHVNFERMTQLATGRYWAQATPDQRAALVREFRTTLVRTYGGAVSAVKDQTAVELRPQRQQTNENDAVVRTVINQTRGESVPIDYRLQKSADGWKIYDVNVLGVWLVDNYRNQFAQQIGQGGIDGLIRTLSERNRSFEQRGAKSAAAAPAP